MMLETGLTTYCRSKEAAFGFAGLMWSDSEMHRGTKSYINKLSDSNINMYQRMHEKNRNRKYVNLVHNAQCSRKN